MLDSSALLAFLFGERGADRVAGRLATSYLCTVNWAETAQRILGEHRPQNGGAPAVEQARVRLEAVGLVIEPFLTDDAEQAALLGLTTTALGLSLGDRSCLALARRLGLPALTADRIWTRLPADLGIAVEQVR